MKLLSHTLVLLIVFLTACNKENDNIMPDICDGLITDTLGTNDNARIYMPTAFTPNGDGKNDMIIPFCRNVLSIEFTIYDQNKTIVFTTNQLDQGWGSTTIGSNSSIKYYYKIQAITSGNHKIGMCGDLYKLSCLPNNTTLYFIDQLTQTGFTNPTSETLPNCR
jgi:gliding motility-associated-like protein